MPKNRRKSWRSYRTLRHGLRRAGFRSGRITQLKPALPMFTAGLSRTKSIYFSTQAAKRSELPACSGPIRNIGVNAATTGRLDTSTNLRFDEAPADRASGRTFWNGQCRTSATRAGPWFGSTVPRAIPCCAHTTNVTALPVVVRLRLMNSRDSCLSDSSDDTSSLL